MRERGAELERQSYIQRRGRVSTPPRVREVGGEEKGRGGREVGGGPGSALALLL